MWDSTTLATEKSRRPDMAQVILGPSPKPEDLSQYRERITKLTADRKESDPMWWNDLAVAHMRLGEFSNAVALLEPAAKKFPNDYGVHANLGTAYHLMGRYVEAEKEIARDLEINPDAHFGLEKYHLALLQYLIRGPKYQSRHLYVDELTTDFFRSDIFIRPLLSSPKSSGTNSDGATASYSTGSKTNSELAKMEEEYRTAPKTATNIYEWSQELAEIIAEDTPPPYTAKWNLAQDPKLKEGVIYMASLNPKEPACFEMLGVVSLMNADRHLAVAAFEKAIALGSSQKAELQAHVDVLKDFMERSKQYRSSIHGVIFFILAVVAGAVAVLIVLLKPLSRRLRVRSNAG